MDRHDLFRDRLADRLVIGIERWQENFALKAPLHWWIFLLAFLAITIITLLTVTIQNLPRGQRCTPWTASGRDVDIGPSDPEQER